MNRHQSYLDTYQMLHDAMPPATVNWETSMADILNPGRGFMRAFDFTMQLQVGCPGGCLFCYVPAGTRLTPQAVRSLHGEQWGYEVRNKVNVIAKFEKYLHQGRLADKSIYWSGVTDPYAAPPTITRELWSALLQAPNHLRPRRIVVQTRFHPERDVDLMAQYKKIPRQAMAVRPC